MRVLIHEKGRLNWAEVSKENMPTWVFNKPVTLPSDLDQTHVP